MLHGCTEERAGLPATGETTTAEGTLLLLLPVMAGGLRTVVREALLPTGGLGDGV